MLTRAKGILEFEFIEACEILASSLLKGNVEAEDWI